MNVKMMVQEADYKKWLKNTAIFFAPMVLLVLLAIQNEAPVEEIVWIVRLWLLNSAVDLVRKFIATNK